jgi:hypothetical protein
MTTTWLPRGLPLSAALTTVGHVWKGDTQPARMRCAGLRTVMVRALQWLAGRPANYPVPPDLFPSDKASVRGEIPLPGTAAHP